MYISSTFLLLVVSLIFCGTASPELLKVVVVHRHGARTPLVWGNDDLCTDRGCGELIPQGKQMLLALGRYISEQYGTVSGESGHAIIPNDIIDQIPRDALKVVASGKPRTLQSAVGVLEGLMETAMKSKGCFAPPTTTAPTTPAPTPAPTTPAPTTPAPTTPAPTTPAPTPAPTTPAPTTPAPTTPAPAPTTSTAKPTNAPPLRVTDTTGPCPDLAQLFAPAIYNVPNTNDALLRPLDSTPAIKFWGLATNTSFWAQMDHYAVGKVNKAALMGIAKELGLNGECMAGEPIYSPYVCTLDAQDFLKYAEAIGTAEEKYPFTYSMRQPLDDVMREYNQQYSIGAVSKEDQEQRGLAGYPLLKLILEKDMRQPFNSSSSSSFTRLVEYSGHDTTVIPLQVSLHVTDESTFLPPFGAAVILEVYKGIVEDNGVEDVDTRIITAKYGVPNKADDVYKYTFTPKPLQCADAGKSSALPGGCTLGSLTEYVTNNSAPHSKAPDASLCYVNATTAAALNCTREDKLSALSGPCYEYRVSCPEFSCMIPSVDDSEDATYLMNYSDYNCIKLTRSSSSTSDFFEDYWLYFTAGGGGVALVAILALLIVTRACRCRRGDSDAVPLVGSRDINAKVADKYGNSRPLTYS